MKIVLIFVVIPLVSSVFGTHLIQEDIKLEFINRTFLDVTVGLDTFNNTKILNATIKIKVDIPDNFMVYARGFRRINNDYRLKLFQYDTTLQKCLQMELFDLQVLFLKYTRPPLIWPLEINTVYRSRGWTPDYTKWLPNFPEGKWKIQITYAFANKTKVLVANWFLKIE